MRIPHQHLPWQIEVNQSRQILWSGLIVVIQIKINMYKGRQKKLENLAERKSSHPNGFKTPFLQEHSSKMEQKLAYLRQKISEKKKHSISDKKTTSLSSDLTSFMTKIAMHEYLQRLQESGIDSYDILKEVKQSELQELGIPKGHALKIVVNIKKEQERNKKKSMNDDMSKVESTLDQSAIKKIENKPQKKSKAKEVIQIFDTQTESIPLQRTKKQFCLYCFSRSQHNFCSTNCQNLYGSMFQRYENNLHKAQESFIPKKIEEEAEEEELSDNQEFIQDFDFLFSPQLEDFAVEDYEKIKDIIRK